MLVSLNVTCVLFLGLTSMKIVWPYSVFLLHVLEQGKSPLHVQSDDMRLLLIANPPNGHKKTVLLPRILNWKVCNHGEKTKIELVQANAGNIWVSFGEEIDPSSTCDS